MTSSFLKHFGSLRDTAARSLDFSMPRNSCSIPVVVRSPPSGGKKVVSKRVPKDKLFEGCAAQLDQVKAARDRMRAGKTLLDSKNGKPFVVSSLANLSHNFDRMKVFSNCMKEYPTVEVPTLEELSIPMAAFYNLNGRDPKDNQFRIHQDCWTAKRLLRIARRKWNREEMPRATRFQ